MGAKGTIESYDRIAADYLQRWQDRSIVRQAMEQFVALLPSGGLVVDVGCGPGFDTATLRTHGLRAVGMDLSLGMLAAGRSRFGVPLIQADMRHLPLPALVDGLWVNASLLHLARHDVLPALQGFWRVLKPGGVLYLSLKEGEGAGWNEAGYVPDAPRFFTYWQGETLDRLLHQAAFVLLSSWENPGGNCRWLNRIARKEAEQPGA